MDISISVNGKSFSDRCVADRYLSLLVFKDYLQTVKDACKTSVAYNYTGYDRNKGACEYKFICIGDVTKSALGVLVDNLNCEPRRMVYEDDRLVTKSNLEKAEEGYDNCEYILHLLNSGSVLDVSGFSIITDGYEDVNTGNGYCHLVCGSQLMNDKLMSLCKSDIMHDIYKLVYRECLKHMKAESRTIEEPVATVVDIDAVLEIVNKKLEQF